MENEVEEAQKLGVEIKNEAVSVKQMLLDYKESHRLSMKKEFSKYDTILAQKRVLQTQSDGQKNRL
jgi:hypothetical protein